MRSKLRTVRARGRTWRYAVSNGEVRLYRPGTKQVHARAGSRLVAGDLGVRPLDVVLWINGRLAGAPEVGPVDGPRAIEVARYPAAVRSLDAPVHLLLRSPSEGYVVSGDPSVPVRPLRTEAEVSAALRAASEEERQYQWESGSRAPVYEVTYSRQFLASLERRQTITPS